MAYADNVERFLSRYSTVIILITFIALLLMLFTYPASAFVDTFSSNTSANYNYTKTYDWYSWPGSYLKESMLTGDDYRALAIYNVSTFGYGHYEVDYIPYLDDPYAEANYQRRCFIFGAQEEDVQSNDCLSSRNGYAIYIYRQDSAYHDRFELYRTTVGDYFDLQIEDPGFNWTLNNTYHIEVDWFSDGRINASVNGTQILSVIDNTYSSGYMGVGTRTAGEVHWDNLSYSVAPTCAFSADDTDICEGTTVTYTDASTNTPTDWDWYNETTKFSDLQNPTLRYDLAGTWNTSLYCANAGGSDWENKTDYISVDAPPVAGYSANETDVCTYEVIEFTDASTNDESWWYLFGDSQDSHLENPTHYYDVPGDFTVSQEVDNSGCTSDWENKTDYIHVEETTVTDFSAGDVTLTIGNCTALTDSSTGTEETYIWAINGSETNVTQNADFCCAAEGDVDVQHYTANSECVGDWENKTAYISCGPAPTPTTTVPPTSPPGMYAPEDTGESTDISGQIWLAAILIIGTVIAFSRKGK